MTIEAFNTGDKVPKGATYLSSSFGKAPQKVKRKVGSGKSLKEIEETVMSEQMIHFFLVP